MASLAAVAERIGSVTQLIATIARQTNLLALNATIEAAPRRRFGPRLRHCRPRSEVSGGGNRAATVEISDQIGSIQAATSEAVGEITEIGVVITRMSEIAMAAVGPTEEEKATGRSIALNLQEAAAKTIQVTSSAGAVTDRAKETGGASVQVLKSVELLSGKAPG